MNILLPYVYAIDPDPNFSEFTYGDVNVRGRKLSTLNQGDYLFFHTTINRKKYITAYFVVYTVMETGIAKDDKNICPDYQNIHLTAYKKDEFNNDFLVFGDHVRSRVLKKPLLFNQELAQTIFPDMKFPTGKSETQVIGSATRQWREIDDSKRIYLLEKIKDNEEKYNSTLTLTSEEVANTIEKDIENFIANDPTIINKSLKLIARQHQIGNKRLDLILGTQSEDEYVIVEVKQGYLGRNALSQIREYVKLFEEQKPRKKIRGVLVGDGVMPAFEEDLLNQDDIQIMTYGWNLGIHLWKKYSQ
jgi:hypothetical protein